VKGVWVLEGHRPEKEGGPPGAVFQLSKGLKGGRHPVGVWTLYLGLDAGEGRQDTRSLDGSIWVESGRVVIEGPVDKYVVGCWAQGPPV
jgi:hypothetical protein